jgi:hypothetical protein
MSYVVTDLVEADYQEYYNGFANRVLADPALPPRPAEFSRRDSAAIAASTRILPISSPICCSPMTSSGCTTTNHPLAKMLGDRGTAPHRILPARAVSAAGDPTALPNHEWLIRS